MQFQQFSVETINDLEALLLKGCQHGGPAVDLDMSIDDSQQQINLKKNKKKSLLDQSLNQGVKKSRRREQHYVVKDLILALSLCHNVTPVY